MRRSALRDLFRHLVMSSLPLAAACNTDALPGAGPQGGTDGPPGPDAVCVVDLVFNQIDPLTCANGGYVPISGSLPIDDNTECLKLCPSCGHPMGWFNPVSYTHLTLPTIYSV